MDFQTRTSDFYGYENLLSDREKDTLMALRTRLDETVRPVA